VTKRISFKLPSIFLILLVMFGYIVSTASAQLFITNISGTTTPSTTDVPPNYHHFYSSKESVSVEFKVDQFIETAGNPGVEVKLQKSNGLWWTTQVSKIVDYHAKVTLNSSAGIGDWRLVVTEIAVPTGSDKPPLYRAKSTKYSGTVSGY